MKSPEETLDIRSAHRRWMRCALLWSVVRDAPITWPWVDLLLDDLKEHVSGTARHLVGRRQHRSQSVDRREFCPLWVRSLVGPERSPTWYRRYGVVVVAAPF
jgi:hypothetical protein